MSSGSKSSPRLRKAKLLARAVNDSALRLFGLRNDWKVRETTELERPRHHKHARAASRQPGRDASSLSDVFAGNGLSLRYPSQRNFIHQWNCLERPGTLDMELMVGE